MDTRTLKRLFPFLVTGKPCTKEQAAALALCATGDSGRLVNGVVVVVEAEEVSRLLVAIDLITAQRTFVEDAREQLRAAVVEKDALENRLHQIKAEAARLAEEFDRQLYVLEKEARELMAPRGNSINWFDPFSVRNNMGRPGKVRTTTERGVVRVWPDGTETPDNYSNILGRGVRWGAASEKVKDLQAALDKVDDVPLILLNEAGQVSLSKDKIRSMGEKTIGLRIGGRLELPQGAATIPVSGLGPDRESSGTHKIDVKATRALLYLARQGILEKIS
jgi:hypothetical protein